jgi:hypothetical protein
VSLHLHIDRVVLHGAAPRDRARLQEALRRELTSILTTPGATGAQAGWAGGDVHLAALPPAYLPGTGSPVAVAGAVGGAISGAFGGAPSAANTGPRSKAPGGQS